MSWFTIESIQSAIKQLYDYTNNEEAFGEGLADYAYTIQTGYPRYILNNFSLKDLQKFLNSPQLDTFFVVIAESREPTDDKVLEYGVLYKNHTRGGEWYVSSADDEESITSVTMRKFLTGKSDMREEEDGYSEDILEDDGEFLSDDLCTIEKNILLLRPKTGSFSNEKIRKKIALYESKTPKGKQIDSEFYVFEKILSQPEYLDQDMFRVIRNLMIKTVSSESDTEAANNCKKICSLFDDSFKAYRVGLLI